MKYLYAFLLVVGLASCSKEDSAKAEYKEQYVKIAETIAAQIPSNARVSLKLTSPDKNGLPEAFLRKLMAEFSGALVQSSKSRFQILNRNSTEEIWQEAVEFNNQDAAKITKSAGADVSVSLSPKVNEKGIDLSVTAYSLKEDSMGNVLASASELIPMNVKAELGVDVKNLDKKIDKITQLLDKEGEVKKNELLPLFTNFAADAGSVLEIDGFVQKNLQGCGRPTRLKSGEYQMKCKLYYNGVNVAAETMESDGATTFLLGNDICCGGTRTLETFDIHPPAYNNDFQIPDELQKNIKYISCTGGASDGEMYYKYSKAGKEPYFIHEQHTGGTAGQDVNVKLFRDSSRLPNPSNLDFSEKFCTDPSAYFDYLEKKI